MVASFGMELTALEIEVVFFILRHLTLFSTIDRLTGGVYRVLRAVFILKLLLSVKAQTFALDYGCNCSLAAMYRINAH